MNRGTRIFLTAALAVSALCGSLPAQQTPVAKHGQLSVKDGKVVNKDGDPVALRGMSFYWDRSDWNGHQFYTAGAVNTLASDWKVDIVRAAFSGPNGQISKVKDVVDAALDKGIYVILDYHSHNANAEESTAKAFFNTFLNDAKYVGKPNILYEIFNEPIGPDSYEADHGPYWSNTVKPYAETMIDHIRLKDKNNIIVVGTPFYCLKLSAAVANPITGRSNIAYTLHYYSAEHQINKSGAIAGAVAKGMAVFVTEFGTTMASGAGKYDFVEADKWFKILDQYSIGWCNWSVSAFEASSALSSGQGNGSGWSTSESGTFIKGKLAQYATNVSLTVNKTGEGSVTPNKTSFQYGTWVTLKAIPADGYEFANWTVGGSQLTAESVTLDMYENKTISVAFVPAGNLVKNGTFSGGTSPWSAETGAGGAGTIALESSGGIKVNVTAVGSNARSVRVGQSNINLAAGKKYRLTFEARGNGRTITAQVCNSSGTRAYGAVDAALTGTMQPFSKEFDVATADATARVEFHCGTQTGEWYLKNVRLEAIGNATGVAPHAVSASRAASWSVARAAGGALQLRGPVEAGARVSLYDTRGKMVRSANAADGMTFGVGVPAGNYLVVVKNRAGSEVMKARVSLVK